ncbi:phosphonate transporter [Aquabacterium lacunae]|uniref:phosphonate transporter n=1 Tax=Aquabacterium lacunae TaxID=2528630 RepID=UPI001FE0EE82|nr:phosphonate transporter [Aquabacterium lacunae]
MSTQELPHFDAPGLCRLLNQSPPDLLDELPYGVIGFLPNGRIQRYNRHESQMAFFDRDSVLGQHVFLELAPCLNNYLVETRFADAEAAGQSLDETLPYVLTFRMRPTRVRLRLLSEPDQPLRFVLIHR